jgi:hypothetical protein
LAAPCTAAFFRLDRGGSARRVTSSWVVWVVVQGVVDEAAEPFRDLVPGAEREVREVLRVVRRRRGFAGRVRLPGGLLLPRRFRLPPLPVLLQHRQLQDVLRVPGRGLDAFFVFFFGGFELTSELVDGGGGRGRRHVQKAAVFGLHGPLERLGEDSEAAREVGPSPERFRQARFADSPGRGLHFGFERFPVPVQVVGDQVVRLLGLALEQNGDG